MDLGKNKEKNQEELKEEEVLQEEAAGETAAEDVPEEADPAGETEDAPVEGKRRTPRLPRMEKIPGIKRSPS